jgi:hypothetical protein
MEGGGMLSINTAKVSWLKLKLQTVGIFFGVGPGKSSLHLSKELVDGLDGQAGRATAVDAGYVEYGENIVDIDRFSNFLFCRIDVFLCLTHFPDDRT